MPLMTLTRHLLPITLTGVTMAVLSLLTDRAPTQPTDLPPGAVTATTPMSAARYAHSATALRDGRVLVAGGFTQAADATVGAETYDLRTARFTRLPRMLTLRHSHTATTLPDGTVLIAGGYGAGSAVIAAAELFDPVINRFVATGALHVARAGHVAVPLPDGTVLIAGGVGDGWTFLASAEVYDPATGRFTPVAPMTTPRESHVGIRLQDGRVLIVGGHRGRRANIELYASAEMYDAATGTFTRVGDMHVRRHKHDAVLLRDGQVLVTGGADERDSDGVYQSTELFDPASSTFAVGRAMRRGRYKHQGSSVLLANGTVLLAGGASLAERYDPRTRTFELVPGAVPMAGQFSAVAPLGAGRVLITGGYGNGRGAHDAAWVYRP